MNSRTGLGAKQVVASIATGLLAMGGFALVASLDTVNPLSTKWWLLVIGGGVALVSSATTFLLALRSVTGMALTRNRLLTERRIKTLVDSSDRTLAISVELHGAVAQLRASMQSVQQQLQDKTSPDNVLARLEAGERRVMATLENSTVDHHDSFGAIREQLAVVQREVDPTRSGKSIRSHISSTATDTLRQVEALLQLIPRVDTATKRYPASGGYAMNAEGLLLLSDLVRQHEPRLIVELGSGTSTVWGGTAAQRVGSRYVAIEHDSEYLDKTRLLTSTFSLEGTVECRLAELCDVPTPLGTMQWYDPSALSDLDGIDMLIVDGPPGWTGDKARYPALPVLAERLADNCLIVVDDVHRADEREVVCLWLEAFPSFCSVDSGVDRIDLLVRR